MKRAARLAWAVQLWVCTAVLAADTPTAFEATGVYGNGFTANWSGCDGCEYLLDVSADPYFWSYLPGYQDYNVGGDTSAMVWLETPGTYYYRVRAQDGNGTSDYSETITVQTLSAMVANYAGAFEPVTSPNPLYVGDTLTVRLDTQFALSDAQVGATLWLDTDQNLEDTQVPSGWGWGMLETRDFMQVLAVTATSPTFTEPGTWYWGVQLSFSVWDPLSGPQNYGDNYWYVDSAPWWDNAAENGQQSMLQVTVNSLPELTTYLAQRNFENPTTVVDLNWQNTIGGRTMPVLVVRSLDASFDPPQTGTTYAPGDPLGSDTVVAYEQWSTAVQDTGRAPNTTYYYRFYVENQGYYSWGVDAEIATEGEAVPDPTGVSATVNHEAPQTSLNLSWTDATGGAGQVLVVRSQDDLFVSPSPGTSYSAGEYLGEDAIVYVGAGDAFTDDGLTADTTYHYRFHSVMAGVYSPGAVASAATDPEAPPDLRVLGINGAAIANGDLLPDAADGTDFGEIAVAGGIVDRVFTITNLGPGVLNLGAATLSGPHAGDFTLLPQGAAGWGQATAAAAWPARYEPELLSYDGKLWLFGGGRNDNYTNDVWSSSDGVTWTLVTSQAAWSPRFMQAAVVFDGRMWVLGGYSSAHQCVNDVWSSTDGITWTRETAAAGWSGRAGHSAVVMDGRIWVFGGDAHSMTNDVWSSSDGVTWTCATRDAGWSKRTGLCGFAFDHKLWVVGGGISGDLQGDVWYSSADGSSWTQVGGTLPPARYFADGVVHNGRMWVMGGVLIGGGRAHDVWSSADGLAWSQEPDAAWGERDSFAVESHQGALWLAGGYNGSYFGDVWYLGASSVAAGAGTPLAVRFHPSSVGGRTAVVSIASSDAAQNPYVFRIRGEGLEAEAPAVNWSATTADVAENGGVALVDIVLASAADATVQVQVAAGGSAVAGADFALSATQFIFAAGGAATRTLHITGVADWLSDQDKTASLQLVAGGAVPGASDSLALSVKTGPCVSGVPPNVSPPGDRTFTIGVPGTINVVASDPGCYGPGLLVAGLPSGAQFDASPDGTNTVGALSWQPYEGQEGAYPLRFLAVDGDPLSNGVVCMLYVAGSGEILTPQGVPQSQTNWHVEIEHIEIPPSGDITLQFDAVNGMAYDIYRSDMAFDGTMTWTRVVPGLEANGGTEDATLPADEPQRFFQVVPAGAPPTARGVWGVIRPTVEPSSFTMLSPPLAGDRSLHGEFGANLAQALTAGDVVHIYRPESSGWLTFTLNGGGVWMDGGQPAVYELPAGRGFFVQRNSASAALPRFAGPVGEPGTMTNVIADGDWNIVGLSQGRTVPVGEVFTNLAAGQLNENWDETLADVLVVMHPDGSYRRVMRAGNHTWFDLETFAPADFNIEPGQALYFYRQPGAELRVRF